MSNFPAIYPLFSLLGVLYYQPSPWELSAFHMKSVAITKSFVVFLDSLELLFGIKILLENKGFLKNVLLISSFLLYYCLHQRNSVFFISSCNLNCEAQKKVFFYKTLMKNYLKSPEIIFFSVMCEGQRIAFSISNAGFFKSYFPVG